MKTLILIAALYLSVSLAHAGEYGSPITLKKSQSLSSAIASFKSSEKNNVLLKAKVENVCKKKGCWMSVSDTGNDVRVTFEDYAFFVPQDILGKTVEVQGQLIEKEVSVKEQKHFAEDAEQSKEEIAKITKPKKTYRFIATGVRSI